MNDSYAVAKRNRLHRLLIPLLILQTLLAYANSFRAGFPLDNRPLILEDSRVSKASLDNVRGILAGNYWYRQPTSGLYRPVTTLSYLFNYAVLGNAAHPTGYHVVNSVLHCVNVILVYLLVWHLSGRIGLSFATASLWAVHPLLTESVTNIVGRADLLAGAAVLGALLCHIRTRPPIGLACLTTVGIFAKENVVALPLLMAAYDLTFRPRTWRGWLSGYYAVLTPLALWWWARSQLVPSPLHPITDNPLLGTTFFQARLAAIGVMVRYLALLAFPGKLSFDYSYNQIAVPGLYWPFGIAACASFLAIAIVCFRRAKAVFFWILFSIIAFLPTSNLIILIGTIMAERLMYLPAIGFCACLAASLSAACRKLNAPALMPTATALLCIGFGCRTHLRNFDWKDEETLAASGVAASPDSFKTHMALADALALRFPAELDHAIQEIERALAIIDPIADREKPAIAFQIAGTYYRMKGEANPGTSAFWYGKARDVLLRGAAIDRLWDRRLREHQMANGVSSSSLSPYGLWRIHLQLGLTWVQLNQPRRALDTLEYGRLIAPYQPDFYGFMAQAYGMLQDYKRQAITLMELSQMLPDDDRPAKLLPLVWAHMDLGGCRPAFRNPETGRMTLNLDCPVVHEQVCVSRQNLVRLLVAVQQPQEADTLRAQAQNELHCVVATHD